MANKEVDLIDVAPLVAFPVFAALALGAISLEFSLFGGFSFTEILYSGSGLQITIAGIIATVAAGLIAATNELFNDQSFNSDMEKLGYIAGILIILGAVPMYMVIPAVRDLVAQHDVINAGIFVLQSGVAAFIAWFR